MKKYFYFIIAGIWCYYALYDYYYSSLFDFLPWILIMLLLLAVTSNQAFKLIKERKSISIGRIVKIGFYISLISLTLNEFIMRQFIEKVDTYVFSNQRKEIVEKVKSRIINPNVKYNDYLCELHKGYPHVSNPDNDIIIYRYKNQDTVTVIFFIYANFMEAPSTMLIYTNEKNSINKLEEEIIKNPEQNWKVEENWYRFYGEDFK